MAKRIGQKGGGIPRQKAFLYLSHMRKYLPVFFLWFSPFLALLFVVAACSENEKYLAHGTTEEDNAQLITDTVAYMKILSTWESEPVDSSKVVLDGDSSISWYEVNFDWRASSISPMRLQIPARILLASISTRNRTRSGFRSPWVIQKRC